MNRQTRKRIIIGVIAVLILAAIVYGFLPEPIQVQTATVERAPLQVAVEEEGETDVRNRYVISSPVPAFARRVQLQVGDEVAAGQPVVQLEPPRPAILDTRTRAEASARLEAAQASLERAEVQADRLVAERDRIERLAAAGSATRQALEQASAQAAEAVAAREAALAEVAAARATLQPQDGAEPQQRPSEILTSPVHGRVLAVHRRSGGHVNPGEPLVDVGNIEDLEVTVDVLSQDAVRIRPGTRVLLDQWGDEAPLEAVVTRVAPQGFTTVSALGVEERRVQVSADITSPIEAWRPLGTGYRVLARFLIWEDENALQVPTAALFRAADGWAVFVVEGDRAVLRPVTLGQQTGLAAQVVSGLSEGEQVIVHPPNAVEDGASVRPMGS